MDRISVKSTMINSIGYDPATRILEVEFSKGAVYHALDVPPELIKEMQETADAGGSVGKYYNLHIRNDFEVVLVGDSQGEAPPEPAAPGTE